MSALPQVSVIVPVRNAAATLPALLDSLLAQRGVVFETIVIVNASTDTSASIVRTHPLKPHVVVSDDAGAYGARNTGARIAIATALAFIDADCVADPNWLGQGLIALDSADLVGGAVQQVTSARPNVWEQYDATFYLRQRENVDNGFAATANAFIARETFDAVGGFNPGFVSGGDHEFGARLRENGHTVGYAPDAVVHHRARASAREVLKVQRRIGAGWHTLAKAQRRPSVLADPGVRPGFSQARLQVRDGTSLARRSRLYPAHGLVTLARLVGRVTGR